MDRLYVPPGLDRAETLAAFLSQTDLRLPEESAQYVALGRPLSAAGRSFTIGQVDAALAKFALSIGERIAIKAALGHHRLLAKG